MIFIKIRGMTMKYTMKDYMLMLFMALAMFLSGYVYANYGTVNHLAMRIEE
jgi:hypothetical protein